MAIRPYRRAFERPMHWKTYVKEAKCKARQLYRSRILVYGGRKLGVADLPSGNATILPAILEYVRSGSVSRFDANVRGMAITAGPRFRSYVRRRDVCAFLAPVSDSFSANSPLPNLAVSIPE